MFPAILETTRQSIETVRKSVVTTDQVRDMLVNQGGASPLRNFMSSIPSMSEWKIYDHCAALTRLYAIYESFVTELITAFLGIQPTLYKYTDLTPGFHNEYRNGIAYVLQRMEWRRYQHLSTESIVSDYHDALSGVAQYTILPESILRHEDNLGMNALESLFNRLNISDVRGWISNHRRMRDFIFDVRGEQTSVKSELDNFVHDRNDAAHGYVENVLGKEPLLDYCGFIDALCQSLYERVNHRLLNRQLELGTAHEIGIVTEEYSNRIIVAKLRNTTVALGDSLFFMGTRYCYSAIIESIQIDDVNQQTVTVSDEQEIGFQTNVPTRENARIVRSANQN